VLPKNETELIVAAEKCFELRGPAEAYFLLHKQRKQAVVERSLGEFDFARGSPE
jgi:hypothetical protein